MTWAAATALDHQLSHHRDRQHLNISRGFGEAHGHGWDQAFELLSRDLSEDAVGLAPEEA
jgi:hypothetical protein